MIINVAIATLIGVIAFFAGEAIRRKLGYSNEFSRKLVHTIHGLTVISWVFLANETFIVVFEIVFFAAMFVFRQISGKWPSLLGWLYQVGRSSYGEFFYPLGVIAVILLGQSEWFIVAALLQLAVADSVAAVIGRAYGKSTEYEVFGGTKSAVGSLAFILTSAIIFAAVLLPTNFIHGLSLGVAVLVLPLVLAVVENVSIKGSDNLWLPLATILALNVLA